MAHLTRRQFVSTAPAVLGGAALGGTALLPACSSDADLQEYAADAAQSRRSGPVAGPYGAALSEELVRYATLAPSSHNTQCWRFAFEPKAILILADPARRCPAVDPDDHHLFVSLGCAAENLVHAARAHGLAATVSFDVARQGVRIALAPAPAELTPLFQAIPARQCTRSDFDGRALERDELALLERAGSAPGVNLLLLTGLAEIGRVCDWVVQANTLQMADPAFVRELKSWIRFNGPAALRTGDGLFSACTGNPAVPTWLGDLGFRWFFRTGDENDKYARQIRSSAGVALFVGAVADPPHWVEVGRCYERFALQATALGVRNAMVNQPVEVAAQRPAFATAFGLTGQRPDLLVRFGRGKAMPPSLRRPVQAVLV